MATLFENLKKARPSWSNEEELRKGWLKHIENKLGMTFHAERERNDASYNQVIIEFKSPGFFKGNDKSASFIEAIDDRLLKYIKARSKSEGIPEEDYIGIAIDGDHICFAFMQNGKIVPRNLLPFNPASVELVAQACVDSKRRAVTAKNLVEDFGHSAEIGSAMMATLVELLEKQMTSPSNNKIKLLFDEWRTLFGQVADLSAAQAAEIRKSIPFSPALPPKDMVAATLFAIHTYNAFVIKMLAAEIIAQYGLTAYPDFCEHLLGKDDDQLLSLLDTEVEQGQFFDAARITGFVEEAVFSWYADRSLSPKDRSNCCATIRPLLTQLALYRMDDLSAARSHDVLKSFYQALVPESLRKALGEFYTPDWLADVACDRAEVSDWANARILDPTCGSGSFLLEAIRRKRKIAMESKLSAAETLAKIIDEVWGFDLNPLAVQASRVNFLIAIADLISATGIEVELPVLLADAVYSPAHSPTEGQEFVEYGSAVAGQFDVIVGNPPWVRWSNLPEQYRERIKPTCEQYTIFSETPYHGGNELDISGIITYTVADKWLKPEGVLVFVITQTHFQSPSSQGFRSFRINDDFNLVPECIDDLKHLKPFPKVANKTAIMRLRKVKHDQTPKYPVPYRVWRKAEGASASIPEGSQKEAVLSRVDQNIWEANPVNGGNSPWAILPQGRFADMASLQGKSDWISGRKGVTADLNGVYMVRIINKNSKTGLVQVETRPEAGKINIGPSRQFWIEPDLLYPLLKGAADFSACDIHVRKELYILVPNKGINASHYKDTEDHLSGLKQTQKYFKHFKPLLQNRSTYRLRQKGAPYYAVYNSGTYTFAPYKVVWAELSTTFEAAVFENESVPLMGKRPYVPDHKVYFADFTSKEAAHFVCGILNSTIVREYVESHTIQIQVSNIFKHLSIPQYEPSDAQHTELSKLSQTAHKATSKAKRVKILSKMSACAEVILGRRA